MRPAGRPEKRGNARKLKQRAGFARPLFYKMSGV